MARRRLKQSIATNPATSSARCRTLIVTPSGEMLLLDAGTSRSVNRVLAVLKKLGVRKIDYMVGTHYHEDHVGGVAGIADQVPIGKPASHSGTHEHHHHHNAEA